jgi:hypothetical protein
VYYAKIVVRVLMHSPRAEGEWTMRQNPGYYFGIVHAKCNINVIIMLTVHMCSEFKNMTLPGTIYRCVKKWNMNGVTLTFKIMNHWYSNNLRGQNLQQSQHKDIVSSVLKRLLMFVLTTDSEKWHKQFVYIWRHKVFTSDVTKRFQ